ncbi:peptidyl-prolyl cis-trans isomerase D [Sphingomonas kaistensis]|uniref:Parvulin-like PPIase n=1 Tax=Sphingomonas kaistensis TaxID=298708 RepID=A0A7X5Y7P2_9SPHN|nr:peptidylprolyl isomerase [Sphingomonas kaistensis]NJC06689.1 peptidyl-prolyl cis-trans isomerase D [Sphingomonas kaistensis]
MKSFRRLSKSKLGTGILILFLLLILASFAIADISNLSQGGSLPQTTLAKVGKVELTANELDTAMQRRLAILRQQNPQATYADLAPEFDAIVEALIQERTLWAYAQKHGFVVSKKLVDAEIVKLPGVRGLDGRFSEASYQTFLQQERITDAQLRREIETSLLQRLVIAPVAANVRIAQGLARPYADILLEQRSGSLGLLPFAAFANGPAPTAAEVSTFYRQNLARYTVPERRSFRMARITPAQLGTVAATDAEIAKYYQDNQATYGGVERRVLSRATLPDQAAVAAIAARAKAGGTFAAAAAPAGFSASDVSVGPQTRAQLGATAGEAVAAQVFSAPSGAVIGPVQSSTGFDVIKVESIQAGAGRSLADARAEIATQLTAEKAKNALADLVGKVEDSLADGRTFEEVAAENKLPVLATPALTRAGASFDQPDFKLPADLTAVPGASFDIGADDDPVVEPLPNEAGFVLVDVAEVVPAAPAPLARIQAQVSADFAAKRAQDQANAAATRILAAVQGGKSLAAAVAEAGVAGVRPPEAVELRRGALAQFAQQGQEVPPPLRILFSLAPGKAQRAAGPSGIYLVQLDKVVPGNAASNPQLIAGEVTSLQRSAGQELALQWLAAAQRELKVTRNAEAIQAARNRILGGGGSAE